MPKLTYLWDGVLCISGWPHFTKDPGMPPLSPRVLALHMLYGAGGWTRALYLLGKYLSCISSPIQLFVCLLVYVLLRIKPRTSHMLGRCCGCSFSTTLYLCLPVSTSSITLVKETCLPSFPFLPSTTRPLKVFLCLSFYGRPKVPHYEWSVGLVPANDGRLGVGYNSVGRVQGSGFKPQQHKN